MADEPERPRSQYPPPDDPNRGYYPQAPRDGNSRDDKNTYPAPEDPNRATHYQQGSPAAGPPRDDRMPYPPADPSRQPQYPYDPRAGQYQPPQHQWNGQYPPPQYPVSPDDPFCLTLLNLLTIIRILLTPAINILLLQEPMASTMAHLQMHIACRHHSLDLATHTHLHTTTLLPKHLHHVSVRLLPANTVARERSARNIQRLSL